MKVIHPRQVTVSDDANMVTGLRPLEEVLPELTLTEIAQVITNEWQPVWFGAVPYLRAMFELEDMNSAYGADSANSVVLYFLSNAKTWKGETARAVKSELRRRLNG
jgi:hypothetical protein